MELAAVGQWCVYILECADRSLYTGITNDLAARLVSHQTGKGSRYTRSHLPVVLRYWEKATDHSAALKRELAIKKLSRQQKLKLLHQLT